MTIHLSRTTVAVALSLVFQPAFAAPITDEAAVVVTATRMPTRANELLNDVTVLSRADIETSSAASLPELLAAQPGIQFSTNGGAGKSGGLFLRGAESRHTVVLVDGLRLNSATAGDTALQHIPLSQIERIEIVRGPVSGLYGSEAIGGVVQIFTRRGEGAPRVSVQASVGSRNTSDLSASVAGSSSALNYALTVGRFATDGTSATTSPAAFGYNPDADGYRQEHVSGRIGLNLAPGHSLTANLFYSDGVSRYDNGASGYDHRMLHTLQATGLESKNRFLPGWTSTLRLAESMDDAANHSSATTKSVFKTSQTQAVWQNNFNTPLGDIMAGLERLEQRVTSTTAYTVKERGVDSLLLGYQGHLGAHRLQASARRDDNSQFGAKTTGMAYYGYQIDAQWRASVGAGTSFSAPTFNQLYFPGFGTSTLRPEHGNNREAALVWEQGRQRFSATWFDNRVNDLIASAWVGPGPWDYRAQNVQKAQLSGWTLTGKTTLADWHARASLDLLEAKDVDTGRWLPRRAREHLTLGLGRDFGAWSVNSDLLASGYRYDNTTNTRRLGGYAVVNLGVDYRYAADTTLFARAVNLFDKRYELAADYATTRAGLFAGIRHNFR
ncbi:MAG: TonB-dependent receptor [Rhodocyclaceae bacterium]|jgi:vitamin B12 transporter|nr:TonB-dependent receptor [Rhodocyclaceae bacterium]